MFLGSFFYGKLNELDPVKKKERKDEKEGKGWMDAMCSFLCIRSSRQIEQLLIVLALLHQHAAAASFVHLLHVLVRRRLKDYLQACQTIELDADKIRSQYSCIFFLENLV